MGSNVGRSFVLLIISSLAGEIFSEIFSAIEELEKLGAKEPAVVAKLLSLSRLIDDDYVNRKLQSWEGELEILADDPMKYITNPLNAFLMIKRGVSDFQQIKSRFPDDLQKITEEVSVNLPDVDDLGGAVEGLIRLQTIYRLESEDFVAGIIDGVKTRPALSAHDVFTIGVTAYYMENQNFFAQEYLNLAWDLVEDNRDSDGEIDLSVLMLKLVSSYNRTGNYELALDVVEKLVEMRPTSEYYKDLRAIIAADLEKFGKSKYLIDQPYSDYIEKDGSYALYKEAILYSKVCRKNVTKSPQEMSKLVCRYTSSSAFSKLARFKTEDLNHDPHIIMFYDVLNDNETEFLKTITKPKVSRGLTLTNDLQSKKTNERIAQLAWHLDEDFPLLQKLSRRVEDMTGLSQKTAEPLQVQNYGIGGHYVPHWDHRIARHSPFDDGLGNRIATVLFYLSDVEKGGATAFPYLKVLATPKKGAAAFWFNIKPNGEGDYFTRHAACPVLLGTKWVANRWIREHGQEFRRPCPREKFVPEIEEVYHQHVF